MAVYVGSASIDENGRAHGGQAGNQTGRELRRQKWYSHSKGWRVFRAKDAGAAARIAACMAAAIANRHIGYDQYQRNTLYAQAEKVGFDVSRVTEDCETDCSALVRVCCAYAGILGLPSGFRTANEPKNLLATGAFEELTGAKYTQKPDWLRAGDILCTATAGHTVVVLNDGASAQRTEGASVVKQDAPETRDPAQAEGAGRNGEKAGREPAPAPAPAEAEIGLLGKRILKKGRSGADVAQMQAALIALGYSCGEWGADGDFGRATDRAVRAFQRDHGLEADGEFGPLSLAALIAARA